MVCFSWKTKIICGAGALRAMGEMRIGKLFVVTDPFFLENGTARRIAGLAGAQRVEFCGDVKPDPDAMTVARAAAALKAFGADTILALGGGSAMDCAKATAYFAEMKCTLIAVPTTSGSGSEVTDFAVITAGNVKTPLVDPKLQPDVAILDSDLLGSLPRGLIADSGYDAAAHAVEGFVASGHSPMSDALAAGALRQILTDLPVSYDGDVSRRMGMHCASTMAAGAFSQAGLGACHALSHSLGGLFHVPHGRLNGVLLPAVVARNCREDFSRYAMLARQAGLEGTSDFMAVKNLKNALLGLRRHLNLPETLPQAGISPADIREHLPEIVKTACDDACAASNPVAVNERYVREVLETVGGL